MKDALRPLLIATAMLVLIYVGLYLVLVEPRASIMLGRGPWSKYPHYRLGGRAAIVLFWPLEVVDKRIRKRYWEYHDEDYP
jgi:hypothetical protein